ncbi:uncharacterized protein [Zea mays]|uniref:uncharacterized protein isoform X1 n=1 Tax=Zea mays TaxID=4577 RepID=UPI0016529642|nr:uncharacterized protein LOC103653714 isoform X1 [Zea mays]XP_035823235.1 uncharacterized protein LOC103653714 isoform X1 [Zea mays]
MFSLAFGFIDSETTENWVWFMTQLKKALGECPLLAICTDACKGLEIAVGQVFPQAEQRECFRHLMQNFIKRYSGESGGHMWPAARAYDKEAYEKHLDIIYRGIPDAKLWLKKHHKLKWMRSDFNPNIKCDYVTNNVAEVFNNWIKDIKDLPVADLADKIREMIGLLMYRRREIGEKLDGKILPAVLAILRAKTRGLGHLSVVKYDHFTAEVWDNCNHRFVVKAQLHECSCLEWQHTGKPCQHALALITAQKARDVKMEDFVHEYYSVQKFRNAYARMIEPIPHKDKWPKLDLPIEIAAPLSKRSVGRQKKNRIKGCLEGGSGGSKSGPNISENENEKTKKMIRGKARCSGCGEFGHRKSSYKCSLNGTKKRKRKIRKNTTKGWTPKDLLPGSPVPTREQIMQESPGIVTRGRLALLMEEGASQDISPPTVQPSTLTKKMTPKRAKRSLDI